MKELLSKVETEIKSRNISEQEISEILSSIPEIKNRRIIGGYASVAITDREGHKITIKALKEAAPRFMESIFYRNINVFHSDVTVGRVLPKWTNPETGETYSTHIDDIGFYIVGEIRDDIELADKVWEEILKGNIKSFSIAGSSKKKEQKYEQGQSFVEISELDLYEITLCEEPVNPLSKFEIMWNPNRVEY